MCGVIVVDAESIGLLVSDVMPICMIIALDIVMTLRGSINCSTVIRSPTVYLLSWEKPLVNTMAPGSIFHPLLSDLFYFLCQISLLQTIVKGLTTPLSRWVQVCCFCAGVLAPHLDAPTGLIPWFSTEGNTYFYFAASPFPLQGKTNASSIGSSVLVLLLRVPTSLSRPRCDPIHILARRPRQG